MKRKRYLVEQIVAVLKQANLRDRSASSLYRRSDGVRGRGAPVQYRAHSSSLSTVSVIYHHTLGLNT